MRLAVDATVGVTDIVEKVHHTIQMRHPALGTSKASHTRGVSGVVYRSIRGITQLLGKGLDAGMTPMAGWFPEGQSVAKRDAFVSVINGVYGDHLHHTGNPLAIDMSIRYRGLPLNPGEIPGDFCEQDQTGFGGKIMLFVHGLCLNDRSWARDGQNQAETLAQGLGYSPLFLRYNTGLSIAENGRQLAVMIEHLIQSSPFRPENMVIVGHSMGGLVARSAVHHAGEAGHDWLRQLGSMVFMGTPHLGAPLERGGNWLERILEISPYAAPFARIGKKRSAGITDLRHGCIAGQDEQLIPLPAGVNCYAIAGTLAKTHGRIHRKLIGDGLVPVDSALGQSNNSQRCLQIPEAHQWLGFETGHLELLGNTAVFERLNSWLS